MKYLITHPLITLFLFLSFCSTAIGQDRVYLEIGSSQARKIRFAVPWFLPGQSPGNAGSLGKDSAEILADALEFHGIIEAIPTPSYGGGHNVNWQRLGADFVVFGTYNTSGNGVSFELRLFDVAENTMLLGKSYSGKSTQRLDMLYKFSNVVIENLTGSPGLALSQISFVSDYDLKQQREAFISDILGKNIRRVTRHKGLVVAPRFAHGGNFMTYTSYHTGNQNLYITDLRQNKTTRVLSRRNGLNLAGDWMPDGNSFFATLSYKGNPDIYMMRANGSIAEQLTQNSGINVSPTVSPDGSSIVFVSDRFGTPQLFLLDLTTRKTQRITFTGKENAEPSFHPSENLVVYSSLRNGVYQICTKKIEPGAKSQQLTQSLENHESPSWSPDGNQIIFSQRSGKKNKIYAMMRNGKYQRRLFNYPGNETYPRWQYNSN